MPAELPTSVGGELPPLGDASPMIGLVLSADRHFAPSLHSALSNGCAHQFHFQQVSGIDDALRQVHIGNCQFVVIDARSDPERAMVQTTRLRKAAPMLGVILTASPETVRVESFLRQSLAMGATDVLAGPPWQTAIVDHVLSRVAALAGPRYFEVQEQPPTPMYEQSQPRLLAEVGHEMRSPLGAIIGLAESIEQETFGPIALAADHYRDYARGIRTSGEHLLALFDELLEVGAATARAIADGERLAPGTIAERSVAMVRAVAAAKDVYVVLEPSQVAEYRGKPVFGSNRLVQQAILNLLQNAIKFTPPGGQIRVGWDHAADATQHIMVADNGIGMEAEILQQLRSQGGKPVIASPQGHGFGLPFVQRVAFAHGGELHLESVLGEGTKASLRLPPS